MSAAYELIVLGDRARAEDLRRRIREEVESYLPTDTVAILHELGALEDDQAESAPQRVVVWIATGDDPVKTDLESLRHAAQASIALLPVVTDERAQASLPPPLHDLNWVRWEDKGRRLIDVILRMLGLVESERRVFLSYRRAETSELADQLRDALARRNFDVFLDRFSIEPGGNVQGRIDIELGDKAFVLVLESPTLCDSKWIRHEITYAIRHRIPLQALALPDLGDRRVTELDEYRCVLGEDDIEGEGNQRILRAEALVRICDHIEVMHADRLRRHREQLMASLKKWLDEAGHNPRVGSDWTILATEGERDVVYLVTPRAPTPTDLHRAHLARKRRPRDTPGVVAHNPRDLDQQLVVLNTWVAEDRALETAVHEDLRDRLRRR